MNRTAFPQARPSTATAAPAGRSARKNGNPHVDRELIVFPAEPIRNPGGTRFEVILRHEYREPNFLIGRLRLSTAAGPVEPFKIPNSIRSIALTPAGKRTKAQQSELTAAFLNTDRERAPLAARVDALKSARDRAGAGDSHDAGDAKSARRRASRTS